MSLLARRVVWGVPVPLSRRRTDGEHVVYRARRRKRTCPADEFKNGFRLGGNEVPTREGLPPADVPENVDGVARLAGKRVESRRLLRGEKLNADSGAKGVSEIRCRVSLDRHSSDG